MRIFKFVGFLFFFALFLAIFYSLVSVVKDFPVGEQNVVNQDFDPGIKEQISPDQYRLVKESKSKGLFDFSDPKEILFFVEGKPCGLVWAVKVNPFEQELIYRVESYRPYEECKLTQAQINKIHHVIIWGIRKSIDIKKVKMIDIYAHKFRPQFKNQMLIETLEQLFDAELMEEKEFKNWSEHPLYFQFKIQDNISKSSS